MTIELTAMLKTFEDFMELYQPGDEKNFYGDKSLLGYALANGDPKARYAISSFLLDRGAVGADIVSEEGYSTLQVLLSRVTHNLKETYELCKRLIELGVDINHRDRKYGQVAIQYIARLGGKEEDLQEFYDLWFSQPNLDLESVDRAGNSPIEYAKLFNRKEMVRRMEEYEQR